MIRLGRSGAAFNDRKIICAKCGESGYRFWNISFNVFQVIEKLIVLQQLRKRKLEFLAILSLSSKILVLSVLFQIWMFNLFWPETLPASTASLTSATSNVEISSSNKVENSSKSLKKIDSASTHYK